MSRWWSSLKKWFSDLYLVTFALTFIGAGIILLIIPALKGTVWQTLGGALLGSGLTILATAITARQSAFEGYKKEANLDRKNYIYGPLYTELKGLRETFDKAHTGEGPYPQWIDIPGLERPPFLRFGYTLLAAFSLWPTFIQDYRVDNFTPTAQKRLNDVQSLAVTYNQAVEDARKTMQTLLLPHIAASIEKEAQRQDYQEWQRKQTASPSEYTYNRWFSDFIYSQMTASLSSATPLGQGLSQSWTRTLGWLLADKPEQAAQAIYESDAITWDASQHASLSWFQDIFSDALNELKIDPAYQHVQDAQQRFFTELQEAEKMLYQGLHYIRDRYEGGGPPV